MIIVLEGCDGVGKTTLVEKLYEKLSTAKIYHQGPLNGDPFREYEWSLTNYNPRRDHVICDRWHVGECIYGKLYRDGSKLSSGGALHVDLFLQSIGALRLHVDAPQGMIEERLHERGEDFLRFEDIARVRQFYQLYAERNGWLTINSNADPISLINRARFASWDAKITMRYPTYVGPPRPRFLLLGDKHGPESNHGRPGYRSAFVPYADTSGHYLMHALHTVGLNHFGLANACQETDLNGLWVDLGFPRVVALGRNATVACTKAGVPVAGTVDHPQYIRRFKHGLLTEYGKRISGLCHG